MAPGSLEPGSEAGVGTRQAVRRIGCVSFLNARPLIDGLESSDDPLVRFDVPSHLLTDLEMGEVDIALCPVIDYQRSRKPLAIVPVGGIGCDGTTLTVRLYSQVPLAQVRRVHADADSRTSVALLQILLAKRYGTVPTIVEYDAREQVADNQVVPWPEAMVLIGDKVVTGSPPAVRYPHQLDLGHAWLELTGLPFVFAVWMARSDAELGELPAMLEHTRLTNASRIGQIVAQYASNLGWPPDLAVQYLSKWLHYDIGPRQLAAMERFFEFGHSLGLIPQMRPLVVRR